VSATATAAATPRVSVVIPVFNAERHVVATIASALASELADLEVLAVDDGSTDASAAQVASISDPRVRLIREAASGGPSRPRNVGIAHARAPYVAFLDADDLLKPRKLSEAVAALDAQPQAGIAFADFERIDIDGKLIGASTLADYPVFLGLRSEPLGGQWRVIRQPDFARGLLEENFIGTSGAVVRRSFLERIGGFDEGLKYSEDRDLWFRLAHTGDALYQNVIGHSYRVVQGSLSSRAGVRHSHSRIEVLYRERRRWAGAADRRLIDRVIGANLAAIGYDERRAGRRLSSAGQFLRAFALARQARYLRAAVGSLLTAGPR